MIKIASTCRKALAGLEGTTVEVNLVALPVYHHRKPLMQKLNKQ